MDFRGLLQRFKKKDSPENTTGDGAVKDSDSSDALKSFEDTYKRYMSNAIEGCSNMFVDMLCNYGDKKEAVVGVNITPHYVRVCQMQYMFEKWNVTHLDSAMLEDRFTREDMVEQLDHYVAALKGLIKKNKIKSKNVSLSVPLSDSMVRVLTMPLMDDSQLEEASQMEGFWQNLLQVAVNIHEFSVSYRVISRNEEDSTMRVLFIASRLDTINMYTEIVKRAGLNPVIVDVRCCALKNAINVNEEAVTDGYPAAVLELGPDENNVLILDGDEIYTYDISLNNVSVTEAMIENFKNSDMLEMFVHEYANQVRNIIQQHQTQMQADSIKHIYVVSFLPITNTFLDKMSALLQEYFISEYNVLEHIEVPLKLSSRVQNQENLSAWAVTMGAAVRKLGIFDHLKKKKTKPPLNLLPGSDQYIKKERFKITAQISLACVAALAFTISLMSYLVIQGTASALESDLANLSTVETHYNNKKTELAELTGMNKRLRSLDDIKETLPSNQLRLLAAYKRINRTIPDGVWLKKISFTKPQNVHVVGNAIGDQHILDFITSMSDGVEFEKVSLKTMSTVKERDAYSKREVSVKRFTLHALLGDVPEEMLNQEEAVIELDELETTESKQEG